MAKTGQGGAQPWRTMQGAQAPQWAGQQAPAPMAQAPAPTGYGPAPTQQGTGKSSRRGYAADVTDYYEDMLAYAEGGGDMSGIVAPEQKYEGKAYRNHQADAMAAYEAAMAASQGYMTTDPTRGGEGTETIGGITRGEGIPDGGYLAPTQTYTGHTGYSTDDDGVRTGTGGGDLIIKPPPTEAEQLLARPDLAPSTPVTQFATSTPAQKGQVTSIANQMAQAKALRAGGSQDG